MRVLHDLLDVLKSSCASPQFRC